MNIKENLLILLGPTAIGKTELSIELAKKMNGEIISADSMQIYKYMDIGSAKVLEGEMDGVKHHLIDMLYPDEEFTVANYKEEAGRIISEINKKGKLPMVVGGTGLYINSLVYKLNFTEVAPDFEFRGKLESIARERGNEFLHNELARIDKESSDKIYPNDVKRIVRALEIYKVTGKPMSEHNKDFRIPIKDYNLVMVGLNMNREKLYERINLRVDMMIEKGLINEVKGILNMGYGSDLVSMQGIGYKELIMYLENKISLEESIELIKKKSRNYAKRQLTWFRRDNRIKWIDVEEYLDIKSLSKVIVNYTSREIGLN